MAEDTKGQANKTTVKVSQADPSSLSGLQHSPSPAKTTVQEEDDSNYQAGGYHPVYVGDVYNERYQIINKIGYGVYSTVWLVKDVMPRFNPRSNGQTVFRALKILKANAYSSKHPILEREIMAHLRDGNQQQIGYNYICHMLDSFEHQGPHGTHVCLVFELMGETLAGFGAWFDECEVPNIIMRRFTTHLLLALDYAHDFNVIHTVSDLKPDNIYVKFRDHSQIESAYMRDHPPPAQDRNESTYTVIPSAPLFRYYFAPGDEANFDLFDVALGDWGVSRWADSEPGLRKAVIQPVALRSPEVLIGAVWDVNTDFWNLGAVIYEVFRAIRLFSGSAPPKGDYAREEHIAEIVDLFGPFPKALLEKGDQEFVAKVFDEDGRVRDAAPFGRPGLCSETFLPRLPDDVRAGFADFMKTMMKIDPAERPMPEDMLRHPWLGALPPKNVDVRSTAP
ncbi:kinase-like domain-containing protein [Microdochium bolleyi]|uniref:non-specific serine/threonine protein kinase n=1 Tax=Microdochium bolleyi TaxID=196109 RepID=A0A136IRF9_9PEZI|nr:kinase-like domain-containing protein [Microdochium bolleyi]